MVWYVCMAGLRSDPETSGKGCVVVILNFNSYQLEMDVFDEAMQVNDVMPVRFGGAHYCYTDPALRPFVTGFKLLVKEKDRYRLQIHHGTREEIDFALSTYGIPLKSAHHVSKDDKSTCDNGWHHQWLAMMRAREQKEDQQSLGETGSGETNAECTHNVDEYTPD